MGVCATTMRGIFITFEGGDGVGKSTQIKRVANQLRNRGLTIVESREPGGAPGAEMIRELLVTGAADRWMPLSEALLMYAARAEHLDKTILPALKRGEIVLCDRFADSTMAYQGYAGEVGQETVKTLHEIVVKSNNPDLTIVLYAEAGEGLSRTQERSSNEHRFEDKGEEYQTSVTDAFKSIAQENADRCVLIDATRDIETVTKDIIETLDGRFAETLRNLLDANR